MSTPRDRKNRTVKTLHQDRKVFHGPKGKHSADKIIFNIVQKDIEDNWERAKANIGRNRLC